MVLQVETVSPPRAQGRCVHTNSKNIVFLRRPSSPGMSATHTGTCLGLLKARVDEGLDETCQWPAACSARQESPPSLIQEGWVFCQCP